MKAPVAEVEVRDLPEHLDELRKALADLGDAGAAEGFDLVEVDDPSKAGVDVRLANTPKPS